MPSVFQRILDFFGKTGKSPMTGTGQDQGRLGKGCTHTYGTSGKVYTGNASKSQAFDVDNLACNSRDSLANDFHQPDVRAVERQLDRDVAAQDRQEQRSCEKHEQNLSVVGCVQDMADSTSSKTFAVLHRYREKKPQVDDLYITEVKLEKIEVDGNSEEMLERLGTLGTGSFSKVYLGKHVPTQEIVAVKEVLLSCTSSIKLEVDLLRRLRHENIVALRGVYACTGSISIVLEFMTMDLCTVINNTLGSLGGKLEMSIMREVLQGLDYLQSRNVVHNDIKPENILIGTNGAMQVKLTDFGLSFPSGNPVPGIRGTRPFIAPEVYRRTFKEDTAVYIGTAVDMWALGITMVALARSCLPFQHIKHWQYDRAMLALEVFPLEKELLMKDAQRNQAWMDAVGGCLEVNLQFRSSARALLQQSGLWVDCDLERLRPLVANGLMALQPVQTVRPSWKI